MSLIPFPRVANLPGVPQLARAANNALNAALPVLGTAAALGSLWRAVFSTPQWGVFKQVPPPAPDASGVETVTVLSQLSPAITPDTITDMSYRNEYDIADYFIQDGAFATYNKVANPFEPYVRMRTGGSLSDRTAFLQQCEDVVNSMDLYYIMTPEKTYNNVNCYRMEYQRRQENGAYIVEVDLYFREIRPVTAQYTTTAPTTQNAQDPSAAPVQNNGTVSPQTPTNPPDTTNIVSAQ